MLFRVHEGVNIAPDFLLPAVDGDSASKSCGMYGPSHLNNDVAASSTLIHSSGMARLGG